MASITTLKGLNASAVGSKTNPNSISPHDVSDRLDDICDELLLRGSVQVSTTGALATVSRLNTRSAIVPSIGFFIAVASGASPDGITTFASADSGWLWQKVFGIVVTDYVVDRFTISATGTRDIPDGQKTKEFLLKTTNTCSIKIGTTVGGEEIMMDTAFAAGVWGGVNYGVFADGAAVTIYITFTGSPGTTKVIIDKTLL